MHARLIRLAAAVVVSPILVACATAEASKQSAALDDTRWTLSSLNGQPLPPSARVTMSFEKGMVQGHDGCNRYSASYTASNNRFKAAENMVSTKMACPQPVMALADAFLAALIKAAGYEQDARKLTLLDANGIALTSFAEQRADLGGTSWRVTGYNNGKQAVVSVLADSKLTLDFGGDGNLSGSAGCNGFTFTFAATAGKNIKIDHGAATQKMCMRPAGVMEQEAQFLKAIASAANYRLDGDRLELRTADGALAVNLSAAAGP